MAELRWLLYKQFQREKTTNRQAACVGKQAFDTIQMAQAAMRSEDTRRACQPYRCRYCFRWHIGQRQSGLRAPHLGFRRGRD